jgi:hypothetical protein
MVMARAKLERRLARLQSQAEMMLSQHRRSWPDAVAIMQASGLTPDPWQLDVLTKHAPRVLMNCCRQSGKSTAAAALALAEALHPSSLVLVLSPSLRQSQELYRKLRDLFRPYESPVPIQRESALRMELANGSRVVTLPGIEQRIRGFSGVKLLIIDEAARVPDELYYSVRPMLAVSAGRLVALSTPFGKRGFFHQEWTDGNGWHKVKVTAEQCPRISPAFLAEERKALGSWWYRQEYECEFVDTLDQVFSYETVMGALTSDVQPLFSAIGV